MQQLHFKYETLSRTYWNISEYLLKHRITLYATFPNEIVKYHKMIIETSDYTMCNAKNNPFQHKNFKTLK